MQIVINISDKKYESICDHYMFMHENEVMFAVKEGIPLDEVLGKIEAEIEELPNANPSYWHSGDMVDREDVLEILEKYRENEVPDADRD